MATMKDLAVATENRRAALRRRELDNLAELAAHRTEYAAACELSALAQSYRPTRVRAPMALTPTERSYWGPAGR